MGDHSSHSDLVIGFWNLRGSESAQFYLMKTLVNFDIFAPEHRLFSEQLHKIDNFSSLYRSHCVSSNNNPDILSGKRSFVGVGLLWKASFGDLISRTSAF